MSIEVGLMFKKLSDGFSGLRWTIVSGIFLLASLILMLTGIEVPVDPAWVTVILSGYPLLYLAITRLIYQKWISSCLLISMAMFASLAIGELFAAGEVAWIMAIGAILEDMTVKRARKGITELMTLTPENARRIRKDGTEESVKTTDINVGDVLRVNPGERIPADGKVVAGESTVDQSIMTGESLPVEKTVGTEVFTGTMNCFGSIDIETTKKGEDTTLQKLIRMVEEADRKKAPMQRIADKCSVWLVPIALMIAIGAWLISWLCMGIPMMDALERGVTVLVVFCPCALALATPTSIIAAIGQAAKHGVIIKSGEALEAMGKVDTVTFDKTGTLTYGKLAVTDIVTFNSNLDSSKLLEITASAERRSEHPLAKALLRYAEENGTDFSEAMGFKMEAGRGIRAEVEGFDALCGSDKYLTEKGISIDATINEKLDELREDGKALVLTAIDGEIAGVIAFSDVIREDAKEVIGGLVELGIEPVLLTGDNRRAAGRFSRETGIKEVRAELLPGEKVGAIEKLRKSGKTVTMIGDGVNDAPALKSSDVGVAMGSMGSDIAVEAADIALMTDDLSAVLYLMRLSGSTLRTIKGNITASMCINAVAVTLSVLGVLTPVTGALVHNAGSCLVVLNAALLYDRKFDGKKRK